MVNELGEVRSATLPFTVETYRENGMGNIVSELCASDDVCI